MNQINMGIETNQLNVPIFERPSTLTSEWFLDCFFPIIRDRSNIPVCWIERLERTLALYEKGELQEIDIELFYALYKASAPELTGGSNRIDLLEINFVRSLVEIIKGLRNIGISINLYVIDEAGYCADLEGIKDQDILWNWQVIQKFLEDWGVNKYVDLLSCDFNQAFGPSNFSRLFEVEMSKLNLIDFGSQYRYIVKSMEDMVAPELIANEIHKRREVLLSAKRSQLSCSTEKRVIKELNADIARLQNPPSNTELKKLKTEICTEIAKKFVAAMALRSKMQLDDSTVQFTVSATSTSKLAIRCSQARRNPNYGVAVKRGQDVESIPFNELPVGTTYDTETLVYILES